ncbi:MAG: hypothetical protein OSA98_22510 [Rubripirellula sp.]|nr:hypothetical protein [Rubripirellula sp.]
MNFFLAMYLGIHAEIEEYHLIIICTAAIILVVVMFEKFCFRPWRKKERTKQLGLVTQNFGLPFVPTSDNTTLSRLGNFHLFQVGAESIECTNVLEADADEVKMVFFDYSYTIVSSGSGNTSRTTYRQSILHFCSPSLRLPKFFVRPEGLLHKIGSAFSYQDIDFQTHPTFSRKYLLRGEDEAQIRELFNDNVLTFFETQTKISVEANSDQFVMYRPKKLIKPDELKQFMDEGLGLFALLSNPTKV